MRSRKARDMIAALKERTTATIRTMARKAEEQRELLRKTPLDEEFEAQAEPDEEDHSHDSDSRPR